LAPSELRAQAFNSGGHLNSHPKGDKSIDTQLFMQFLISGIIMGVLYCLMSLGVNFIYGIMKVINWA